MKTTAFTILPLLTASGALAAPAEHQIHTGVQSAVSQLFGNLGIQGVDHVFDAVAGYFGVSTASSHAKLKAQKEVQYYADSWMEGARQFVKQQGIICMFQISSSRNFS